MTLSINDAGTWRSITDVYVNDAGTWRRIQEIYVNDNGTWRSVHVGDVISFSDPNLSADNSGGGSATSQYEVGIDGAVYVSTATNPDTGGFVSAGAWITPAANAGNYQVRATLASGDTPSGTLGTYLALTSSNAGWGVTRAGGNLGTTSCVLNMSLRRVSDSVEVTTWQVTLSATAVA